MNTLSALWANYAPHGGVFAVIALAPVVVAVLGHTMFARDGLAAQSVDRSRFTIAIGCILAVAALYGLLMASGDDLVGIDYAQLTAHRFADIAIWPTSGRFFPLAFQEYPFLDLIGRNATVYYAFAGVELALILLLMHHLLGRTRTIVLALGFAWLLSLPGFATCFRGLIYPERDAMLCIVAWLACHRRAIRTGRFWPALGALAAAEYALYLKETTFLLVGGFAAAHMILSWRALANKDLRGLAAAHWIDLGLIALSCVFLGQYAIVILPHVAATYGGHAGLFDTASTYVTNHPLFDLLVITLVVRVARALAAKGPLDPFWDAVAIGAVLFMLGYIKLGMYRDYYAAPVELLAVIYAGRLVPASIRLRAPIVASACLAAAVMIVVNTRVTAKLLLDRKIFVGETRALVADLAPRLSRDRITPLYFPQYGGFQIMEFGAYLEFRGIPVAGLNEQAAVVFRTPHRFPDDRCLPAQPIRCEQAAGPSAGDLIVLLPGREPPRELAGLVTSRRDTMMRPFVQRLLARVAVNGDSPSAAAAGAVLEPRTVAAR